MILRSLTVVDLDIFNVRCPLYSLFCRRRFDCLAPPLRVYVVCVVWESLLGSVFLLDTRRIVMSVICQSIFLYNAGNLAYDHVFQPRRFMSVQTNLFRRHSEQMLMSWSNSPSLVNVCLVKEINGPARYLEQLSVPPVIIGGDVVNLTMFVMYPIDPVVLWWTYSCQKRN